MRVLIVKLSSMGDLVQALPAITDAAKAIPGITFDWAVDESFAEIPQWHPAITTVYKTAHRRWRKNLWSVINSGELKQFYQSLRTIEYDLVIDAQTNIKSAVVTSLSRGVKCGPDSKSVREYGAHWAYKKHFSVPKDQLAINRWRSMFAQALGYNRPTTAIDFGLDNIVWPEPAVVLPEQPFLVFVHNASWVTKRWDDNRWHDLLTRAKLEGFQVVLPWGSEEEKHQAENLAEKHDHARVLPRLSLTDIGAVFKRSAGAVCMDTGLAHIGAALNVPMVTLYGPTDPALIGAFGDHSHHLYDQVLPCMPCYKKQCAVDGYVGQQAQCLKAVAANQVWDLLTAKQQEITSH